MNQITSKDGTSIAFEQSGKGPAVVLVDGALCYRGLGPMGPIARELASGFAVFTYDRRGLGKSGDTAPYSVDRLKAVAHTLPYDVAIMGDTRSGNALPADRWTAVAIPTLVGVGGKSPLAMQNAMRALADVLPNARLRVLDRETHVVKTKAIAPVLIEFFSAREMVAERASDSRIRVSR